MITILASQSIADSPLVSTFIGIVATALMAITVSAIRMLVQMGRMQSSIENISKQISKMESDPDVMRWSNYGRATQALGQAQHQSGVTS